MTSSAKLKTVKILSATFLGLVLLVGSFTLGALYIKAQEKNCDCQFNNVAVRPHPLESRAQVSVYPNYSHIYSSVDKILLWILL